MAVRAADVPSQQAAIRKIVPSRSELSAEVIPIRQNVSLLYLFCEQLLSKQSNQSAVEGIALLEKKEPYSAYAAFSHGERTGTSYLGMAYALILQGERTFDALGYLAQARTAGISEKVVDQFEKEARRREHNYVGGNTLEQMR